MQQYIRLREQREKEGLSQRQVAEQLGMLQQQYQRYEQGVRDIPTPVLIALAELYRVSTDYLLGLTDNPNRAV